MFLPERKNQRTSAQGIPSLRGGTEFMGKVFLLLFLQKKKTLALLPVAGPAAPHG
ncbi:MAG: hypothetical protein ACRYGC_03480 [Janthinobacterium lividum]